MPEPFSLVAGKRLAEYLRTVVRARVVGGDRELAAAADWIDQAALELAARVLPPEQAQLRELEQALRDIADERGIHCQGDCTASARMVEIATRALARARLVAKRPAEGARHG